MLRMKGIYQVNTNRHRLSLLMALDALLTEQSVGGAARALNLSQPAASNALRQLRDWLEDPLLVRAGSAYVLTPRAEQLREPIRRILQDIEGAVRPAVPFDPTHSTRRFTIAATDAFEVLVLPGLIAWLEAEAPGISVDVVPHPANLRTAMQQGELDFMWGPFAALPPNFHRADMFTENLVGLSNRRKVGFTTPSLAAYAGAPHVSVSIGGNLLQRKLEERLAVHNLTLNVGLTVRYFGAAAAVVSQSGFITTMPQRLARLYVMLLGLQMFNLPFEFPSYPVALMWHERLHRDPGAVWMRGALAGLCRSL